MQLLWAVTGAEVDPAFQILLMALIRAFGGASFSTALAMGIILFIMFRQGSLWARKLVMSPTHHHFRGRFKSCDTTFSRIKFPFGVD
jgi:hypothetical protein